MITYELTTHNPLHKVAAVIKLTSTGPLRLLGVYPSENDAVDAYNKWSRNLKNSGPSSILENISVLTQLHTDSVPELLSTLLTTGSAYVSFDECFLPEGKVYSEEELHTHAILIAEERSKDSWKKHKSIQDILTKLEDSCYRYTYYPIDGNVEVVYDVPYVRGPY